MKSLVQIDNFAPFSINQENARYHIINKNNKNLTNEPHTSIRVRDPKSIKTTHSQYLRYSVPNSLDLSFELPENSSVFPRNIYKKPF